MKFSEHLGKGAWAFASRGLPLVYAVAWLLVARTIPLAEFGTLSVFQSLFAMLFTFSDSFALQAIVKFGVEPNVNIEELVTMTTALFISFLSVTLTILLSFRGTVGSILDIPQLSDLLPWLALFALLTMPRVVFSKVLQSNFRMREIFFVDFSNFGVAAILLFILLAMHLIHSAIDVIHVTVITACLSSLVATILVRPHLKFRIHYSRAMLARISQYVRYQAAMGVASTAQQNFDTLVVASFTGAMGAGIYNGAKLLFRGFDIIRETMTLFVFPAASKYYSRNEIPTLRTILEKSTSLLYLVLIPTGVVLALFAPFFFSILFGSKYDASVPIFRILLTVLLVFPVQMVFGVAMSGMGKIKELLRLFLISFFLNAAIAIILLWKIGIWGAAIAFVVASVTLAVQMFFYMRKEVGFSVLELFKRGFFDGLSYARGIFSSLF